MSDDVEQQIRRRLYASRLQAGEPLGEVANFFIPCPHCSGRGQVGNSWMENGLPVEDGLPCPTCHGDGFIPTPAEPTESNVLAYARPGVFGPKFVSSAGRARRAILCIYIEVALSAVMMILTIILAQSADGWSKGGQVLSAGEITLLILYGLAMVTGSIGFILAATFFCIWQYRAYLNLYAMGEKPRARPGWAVASWFIPFVNLYRPVQALGDLAWLSHPQYRRFPSLELYWGSWLLAWVLPNVSPLLARTREFRDLGLDVCVQVAALLCELVAAKLLIDLIRFVEDGQSRTESVNE